MNIRRRTLNLWGKALGLILPLVVPALAFAQKKSEEELEETEARLEGFTQTVRLAEPGSTALYWLLFLGLVVVALIVLFKDAKRTHLD